MFKLEELAGSGVIINTYTGPDLPDWVFVPPIFAFMAFTFVGLGMFFIEKKYVVGGIFCGVAVLTAAIFLPIGLSQASSQSEWDEGTADILNEAYPSLDITAEDIQRIEIRSLVGEADEPFYKTLKESYAEIDYTTGTGKKAAKQYLAVDGNVLQVLEEDELGEIVPLEDSGMAAAKE